jgi:hypothetical protein
MADPIMPSRGLKADDENANSIICSPYTDVHIVNFSYTIDTASSDDASIRDAVDELESRSLTWLSGNLLPCNGRLLTSRPADDETGGDSEGSRQLRPDLYSELGVVGLKSWPDDILSSSSKWTSLMFFPLLIMYSILLICSLQGNCFPTRNKNDTCTVVYGTVSAYLADNNRKEAVENNIRYQMMTFMRSGLVERSIESIKYARYLSPIVEINDNEFRMNPASQPYLHFAENNDDSDMTVTLSILIIAACFTIIGVVGLMLTVKVLFKQEEDYPNVKQQQTVDDHESTIPRTSSWNERIHKEHGYIWAKTDETVETSNESTNANSGRDCVKADSIQTQPHNLVNKGDDWGTNANMSATMRRLKVTKKVPVVRARSGDMINLGSVMEEDDEESPNIRIQ